jgi:2-phosphosulfolactate phosphatase
VEDQWGAGGVIGALISRGWTASPEAEVTAVAWEAVSGRVASTLYGCGSGRALVAAGYAEDVAIATEVDQSLSVPVLREHRFVDSRNT